MVSGRIGGLIFLDDVGAPQQQPALARIAAHGRLKRGPRDLGVSVERNDAERLAILSMRGLLDTEREFLVETMRGIDQLHEVINADLAAGFSDAATVIRGLIETVTVMPTPPGRPPGLKVQGSLDCLVRLASFPEGSHVGGEGGAG
jgi:hypothetical protein